MLGQGAVNDTCHGVHIPVEPHGRAHHGRAQHGSAHHGQPSLDAIVIVWQAQAKLIAKRLFQLIDTGNDKQ